MPPFLVGLLVAAGPLLRGGWDLWAQSILFLAVAAGLALWLIGRLLIGYVPLPSTRGLVWTAALMALAGASAFLSPVSSYAVPAWRALLLGLWIFPAMSVVSKDERALIDEAIRAAGWVLLLLAFYQRFHQGVERPPATFLNQNVFAGTILLLLPLAAQKQDWFLAAGLLVVLTWSRSVGAWLGLAGALVASRRSAGAAFYWLGLGIGFACLVAIYGKLQSPDVLHRWQWWTAAFRMARARFALGFGPGTFAYVLPAYQDPGRDLSALYAHQHFLETAAECGLPYLFLWAAGLTHSLRRGGAHKRFGALAILIQSLWDYPLSIPANFWLFCYFAASSSPESSRGVNVPLRWKLPGCLLAAIVAAGACSWTWRRWQSDRLKAQAVELFMGGTPAAEVLPLLERSTRLAPDSEAERLAAEVELSRLGPRDKPGPLSGPAAAAALRAAALRLDRSAALNPYRASTWVALERLYRLLREPAAAEERRRLGAAYCPVLRGVPVGAQ